jgi:release factor glutamine methyltransferase
MPSSAPTAERPTVKIATLPGVFRPHSDALLLAGLVRERGYARDAAVLDLFTGSGVLAIAAADSGAREVTAVDLSRRAVATARMNARRNGVSVRVLRGDMFAPVAGERFDLITANPPYLPGDEELPKGGPARAWEGGHDGRLLVDRLCDGARDRLLPEGRLLLVQSSLTGEQASLDRLAAAGLRARVIARRRGPLGPLARARAEQLRARGLLEHDRDEEELLVIEAVRDPEESLPPRQAAPARVTPYRDGPYLLRGEFDLTDQDGRPIARSGGGTVALCRCGRSQLRPFCDGTHKLIGFRAPSGSEAEARAAEDAARAQQAAR